MTGARLRLEVRASIKESWIVADIARRIDASRGNRNALQIVSVIVQRREIAFDLVLSTQGVTSGQA